jgi:hypothetical protein
MVRLLECVRIFPESDDTFQGIMSSLSAVSISLPLSAIYLADLRYQKPLEASTQMETLRNSFPSTTTVQSKIPSPQTHLIFTFSRSIRIKGGVTLEKQPANWVAPFIGGSQDKVNSKAVPSDQCAFKKFVRVPFFFCLARAAH